MSRSVPWWINFEPEIISEYAGTRLHDFYTDPEAMIRTVQDGGRELHRVFGYGSPDFSELHINPFFYTVACILGAKLVLPEDTSPQIEGRVIHRLGDIGRLEIPEDIGSAGYIPELIKNYKYLKLKEEATGVTPVFTLHNQSPLGTATVLRGTEIFTDILTEPQAIKELLEIITETALKVMQFEEAFTGRTLETIGLDDDYGGLFSPQLYEEFNFPYLKRMYTYREVQHKELHTETLSRGHLKFLRDLGLTKYDAWPYHDLTVRDIREEIPEIFFTWNIETAKDLYADSPADIDKKYRQAVAEGAPGMVLDVCARGVPRENILAFIDVAREFGAPG